MAVRVSPTPRRRPSKPALRTPHIIQHFRPCSDKPVALAWSLSGSFLAVAVQNGPILLLYVLAAKQGALRVSPIRTYRGHTADVLQMCFSRSNFLLSASMDHCVRLWHTDTALCLRRFVHPDMVTTVAFHPRNENYVISGGCDGTARIWRPADHACVAQTDVNAVITAAQFCADGSRAYLGTYDGRLVVVDVRDATRAPGDRDDAAAAAAAAAAQGDDLQRSFGALEPARKADDKLHAAHVLNVGHSVALGSHRRARRKGGAKVTALALALDDDDDDDDDGGGGGGGTRAMALCGDGRLHVVHGDGETVGRFRTGARKESVALGSCLSADGRWLLVDGVGGAVRVVDVRAVGAKKNGAVAVESVQLMQHCSVTCAALATDGALLHAGVDDASRTLVMAVGADDASLRIVSCEYNDM